MRFAFVGGAYKGRSSNINAQECTNLFPILDQEGGKSVISLAGTPGLASFTDLLLNHGIRGVYVFKNLLYAVCWNHLYKIDTDGNYTTVGTLASLSGMVSMADNGLEMIIVDGSYGYIYNGYKFGQITDPDFPGADTVTYQDGYFIINRPGTDEFYISGLLDGYSWDALDFAAAEGRPDPSLCMLSDHRELWNFGTETIEVFYNTGEADFPFSRIPGAYIESGLGARFSPAQMDNSILWLSDAGQIVRANGYTPQIISTRQIDYQIAQYADYSDAVGYTYSQDGHSFYVLTFPTANETWVYDAATKFWHKRSSGLTGGRHRGVCYAKLGRKHIIGDYETGRLYEYKMDVYTDNGDPIRRVRAAQTVHAEDRKIIFFNAFEIEFEPGVGLITGQGNDPQAMLDWSDDGGDTWSNEHWASIGKLGQRGIRARWRRLGRSRNRVFRVTITDPVKVILIDAHLDITIGAS